MPEQKFYVVWKGLKTGIFNSWQQCAEAVIGFSGAEFLAVTTLAEARTAVQFSTRQAYQASRRARSSRAAGLPLPESYCVDAACSGNPGLLEYRCIHTKTGKVLFHQGPFENGTNNIGEFLAIVHALALLKKKGITSPIYTDSEIALRWVKEKKCKTKLKPDEKNAHLFDLIRRAETWLRENTFENALLKWDTEHWGQIPADFGRK
ncbi:MAG: ribonuclease H family protein [Chloroflexota bacterium]